MTEPKIFTREEAEMSDYIKITPDNLPELGEAVILRFASGNMFLGSREEACDDEGYCWLWALEYGQPIWNKLAERWESDSPEQDDLEPTHFARLPKWEETQ